MLGPPEFTSDGVKDTSLKAKAKTKDFKIVLEDPQERGLVPRTPTLEFTVYGL